MISSMIRNIINRYKPYSNLPVLGRWQINDNINRKIDLANIDNCGDRVCGDLNVNRSIKSIVKDYNERWNEDITIEQYLKKFTRKHRGGC